MKLVILDRDGVINHDSDQFIKGPEEWKPIPGSLEAIARLTQADYRVVVATNQSGIGRGLFDTATLNAIHDKMHEMVGQVGGRIDAIFFCPHTAESDSPCRKPKPGMLVEIERALRDAARGRPGGRRRLRDLQAAAAAGAADPRAHRQGREDARGGRAAGRHAGLSGSRGRRRGAHRVDPDGRRQWSRSDRRSTSRSSSSTRRSTGRVVLAVPFPRLVR